MLLGWVTCCAVDAASLRQTCIGQRFHASWLYQSICITECKAVLFDPVVCSGAEALKPALLFEMPLKRPKQLKYGSIIFTGENLLHAGITTRNVCNAPHNT
jgi:hypothetical protein